MGVFNTDNDTSGPDPYMPAPRQGTISTSQPSSKAKKTPSAGVKAAISAGEEMNQEGVSRLNSLASDAISRSANHDDARPAHVDIQSYRKGGMIRIGGKARLHKGERIAKGRKGKR